VTQMTQAARLAREIRELHESSVNAYLDMGGDERLDELLARYAQEVGERDLDAAYDRALAEANTRLIDDCPVPVIVTRPPD
jgi:hypothetical protein